MYAVLYLEIVSMHRPSYGILFQEWAITLLSFMIWFYGIDSVLETFRKSSEYLSREIVLE